MRDISKHTSTSKGVDKMTMLSITSTGLALGIIAVIIAVYLDETKGTRK
jgi:hypothetical protein